jgi:hypothetical protein
MERSSYFIGSTIRCVSRSSPPREAWQCRRPSDRELAQRLAEMRAKKVDGTIAERIATAMAYEEEGLDGSYDGIAMSAALDAVWLKEELRGA